MSIAPYHNSRNIQDLSPDVLDKVFDYLDSEDLDRVCAISQKMKAVVVEYFLRRLKSRPEECLKIFKAHDLGIDDQK